MNPAAILYHILAYAGAFTFLAGALLLLYQAQQGKSNPRARRVLAVCLLIWSCLYLPACFVLHSIPLIDLQTMSIFSLISGNLFLILCLPFLLELTRPGWVTFRNIVRLTLPYLIITSIYFLVLAILHQPVAIMDDTNEVLTSIGAFNVWYRFVFYLSNCFYLAFLLLNTSVAVIRYRRLNSGEMTPIPQKVVYWLRFYNTVCIVCVVFYIGILLYGTIETYVIQNTINILFTWAVIGTVAFTRLLTPESAPRKQPE